MRSCVTCSRWTCCGRRVGLSWSLEVPSSPCHSVNLWFCEYHLWENSTMQRWGSNTIGILPRQYCANPFKASWMLFPLLLPHLVLTSHNEFLSFHSSVPLWPLEQRYPVMHLFRSISITVKNTISSDDHKWIWSMKINEDWKAFTINIHTIHSVYLTHQDHKHCPLFAFAIQRNTVHL